MVVDEHLVEVADPRRARPRRRAPPRWPPPRWRRRSGAPRARRGPRGPAARPCARSPPGWRAGSPVLADAGDEVGVDPASRSSARCRASSRSAIHSASGRPRADPLQLVPLLLAVLGLGQPGAAGAAATPGAPRRAPRRRPGRTDRVGGGPHGLGRGAAHRSRAWPISCLGRLGPVERPLERAAGLGVGPQLLGRLPAGEPVAAEEVVERGVVGGGCAEPGLDGRGGARPRPADVAPQRPPSSTHERRCWARSASSSSVPGSAGSPSSAMRARTGEGGSGLRGGAATVGAAAPGGDDQRQHDAGDGRRPRAGPSDRRWRAHHRRRWLRHRPGSAPRPAVRGRERARPVAARRGAGGPAPAARPVRCPRAGPATAAARPSGGTRPRASGRARRARIASSTDGWISVSPTVGVGSASWARISATPAGRAVPGPPAAPASAGAPRRRSAPGRRRGRARAGASGQASVSSATRSVACSRRAASASASTASAARRSRVARSAPSTSRGAGLGGVDEAGVGGLRVGEGVLSPPRRGPCARRSGFTAFLRSSADGLALVGAEPLERGARGRFGLAGAGRLLEVVLQRGPTRPRGGRRRPGAPRRRPGRRRGRGRASGWRRACPRRGSRRAPGDRSGRGPGSGRGRRGPGGS